MRTYITLLVLALTASSVMSTCTAADGLTATLTTAVTGYTPTLLTTDLIASGTAGTPATAASAKCAYTVTTTLVCAPEAKLIADIQSYITYQRTEMQKAAGVRDLYIIEKRGEVISILSSLRRINELAKSATFPTLFKTFGDKFVIIASDVAANFTSIVEGFTTYQDARVKCMNALLATQAALLCHSFIDTPPAGVTHHATTPTIALSDTYLGTLNGECFGYITASVKQSSVILAAAYSKGLANLVTGLEKIAAGDSSAATTALNAAYTTFAAVTFSSTASQVPAQTPVGAGVACTSTSCATWIEKLFSTVGVLDQAAAVRGGEVVPVLSFTAGRILREGKERRLATVGITPALASYTFTYGFEKNPGAVDNTKNAKSALRNGIVAVAIAALALFF